MLKRGGACLCQSFLLQSIMLWWQVTRQSLLCTCLSHIMSCHTDGELSPTWETIITYTAKQTIHSHACTHTLSVTQPFRPQSLWVRLGLIHNCWNERLRMNHLLSQMPAYVCVCVRAHAWKLLQRSPMGKKPASPLSSITHTHTHTHRAH